MVIVDVGIDNVVFGLLIVVVIVVVVDYVYMFYLRLKMLFGFFLLFIVGNIFLFLDNKLWIYFEELFKRYNILFIIYWIGW